MNFYTHFILAQHVAPLLCPQDPDAYAWGAIVPDIRYLAGMPRSQTHLPQEQLRELQDRYPQQRAFLLGYRLHCLLDEIHLSSILNAQWPIQLVRRKITPQQAVMAVDFYFLQKFGAAGQVCGKHNEILEELGVTAVQCAAFAKAVNAYLSDPSISTGIAAFEGLGLVQDGRIEKYLQAANRLQHSVLLKRLLLFSVGRAQLERIASDKATELVASI